MPTRPLLLLSVLASLGADAAPSPESLRASTKALLASWAAAQRQGDAAAYLALYDPRNFKGQKRTTSGERKQYTYATWAVDRSRMLKNRPEVAVEDVRIETWRDPASRLKPGVIAVEFLQRWRSPRYADHGPKLMQLYAGPDGKLSIIYEALLQSRPGWDKPSGTARELKMPADDREALALWSQLQITGKTFEAQLASIPEAPQLRRKLARALLSEGNLECKSMHDEGNCGEEDYRWGPIGDDASLTDPCLRRELAVWALENGGLTSSDLEALWPQLEKVFAFDTPYKSEKEHTRFSSDEDRLCSAVLTATTGSDRWRAAAIAAAVANHCSANDARKQVPSLPQKRKLELAAAGVEEAFTDLDPKAQKSLFLGVLKSASARPEFRVEIMQRLAKLGRAADVEAVLRALADDGNEDDRVAALAGATLADLGDASRLPRRPAGGDQPALERALRRLQHDPDEGRRSAALRAFLPKKGKLRVHTVELREYDGNTPPEDRNERSEDRSSVDADGVDIETLKPFFEPEPNQTVSLVWKSLGGKLYLVGMEIESRQFVGCPC